MDNKNKLNKLLEIVTNNLIEKKIEVSENGELKEKNEELKKKNEDMNEKIYNLKKENRELNKKNEFLNKKINNLNKENRELNKTNEILNEKINNLNQENIELKEKLNKYVLILEKDEKLMSIIISSKDEKLSCSLLCKNNNTINEIEEEFYKEFPEYSKTKNIFSYKGKIINKFETLQKNKIKNGDILILEHVD